MKMNLQTTVATAFLFVCIAGTPASAQGSTDEVVKAASRWLSLVDAGAYEQSYEVASVQLKQLTTEEAWIQTLMEARDNLGETVHRKLLSDTEIDELPGAIKGTYRILIYETLFGSDQTKEERVTLEKTAPNDWRVAGYYIL